MVCVTMFHFQVIFFHPSGMEKTNDEPVNANYTFDSEKLLSIPLQQGEPPKHSTPKRSDLDCDQLDLNESSILKEIERDQFTPYANMQQQQTSSHEKEQLINYFDNALQKRFSMTTSKDNSTDVLNRCAALHQYQMENYADTINEEIYNRKMPKFENPIFRPFSSASDSDVDSLSTNSRKNLLGTERNKTMNFGYVSIGESLVLRQKVWNCDSEQMHIRCSILSASEELPCDLTCFKIVRISAPMMRPGESCEITIQYTPKNVERNVAKLIVERENGKSFRYSFTLIGDGGKAQIKLDSDFDGRIAYMPNSGQSILIQPDIFNRFWLTFRNVGQRAAFVSLIATDRRGNILSREVGREQQLVSLRPSQFVLGAPGEGPHERNVLIRIDEAINSWTMDEETDLRIQQQLSSGRAATDEYLLHNGRDSIFSSVSTNTTSQTDCAVQITAYWGEESQRQRLKYWERDNKPYRLNGFQFTGNFENEPRQSAHQKRQLKADINEYDAQEFKNGLRIIKFNVVDDRAQSFFPTNYETIQPILRMYQKKNRLLKEVFPSDRSNDAMYKNASTITPNLSPRRVVGNAIQWPVATQQRTFDGRDKTNNIP